MVGLYKKRLPEGGFGGGTGGRIAEEMPRDGREEREDLSY